jgi:hypothetical protein
MRPMAAGRFWVLAFLQSACGSEAGAGAAPDAGAEVADAEPAPDAPADGGDALDDSEVPPPEDAAASPRAALHINEFDCREDWVELAHVAPPDVVASLEGWRLGDGDNSLALSGSLAGGGLRVVPLSGFGLACGSEGPVLTFAGETVDAADPGSAPEAYTMGRMPGDPAAGEIGDFTITAPTPGAPNRLPEVDPADPGAALFGVTRPIATLSLSLSDAAAASLGAAPYSWVLGSFSWREDGAAQGTAPQPVAVRLKGRIGSFRGLDGKAGFKLDFERFSPGGGFGGVEAMTLNNMVQDFERVREVVAYALFERAGVPVPRTAHVWVRLNGQDLGLYLHVEALDRRWMARNFPSTQGFFEGQYGEDLFPGLAFRLDQDHGEEAARLTLDDLAQAIAEAPAEGFMAHLAPLVDWGSVLPMLATEVFIGHWDGYGPTRNNWFVHLDDAGVARLVPWGLDQTFGADLELHDGQGLLLSGCVRDPACRYAYDDALAATAAHARDPAFRAHFEALPALVQPWMEREPREDAGDATYGIESIFTFLHARAARVDATLACVRDPLADLDGDGHQCADDCDEGAADTWRGAVDVCGDGRDQDCSGRADDAEGCADCAPVVVDGQAGRWLACWRGRTWEDARSVCEDAGYAPLVFGSAEEVAAAQAAMWQAGLGESWVGLTDLEEEGVWRWLDGTLWDGAAGGFVDGEPTNWEGREHCVHMFAWAGERPWNDLPCDATNPILCEAPPTP